MLDTVDIEGLKGVGRVELRFDPEHCVRVLFGVNGVGKTKTLEAIYLSLLFTQSDFLESEGQTAAKGKQQSPCAAVWIDGQKYLGEFTSSYDYAAIAEAVSGGARHVSPVVFIGAGGRSSVATVPAVAGVLGQFADRRKRHFERLIADFNNGELRSSGMSGDIREWFVQRAQSVNPFQVEKDNLGGEINAVLHLLNEIDPRVDAQKMQIDAAQRVFLSIEGKMLELGELSSGFTSIVKLFQAIVSGYSSFTNSRDLRNVRGVVLIDEIESHLHVSWQTSIVKRLKALFPNTIFIIATHSPLVLAQLEQGEAYLLQRSGGVVRASEIDSPNMKAFADVLEDVFGVDLNALKRDALAHEDQTEAKQALLDLIKRRRAQRSQEEKR